MYERYLIGYAWESGQAKQVVYTKSSIPGDGHLRELRFEAGVWKYADLSQLTSTGEPGDTLGVAYEWPAAGTKQVVYTRMPLDYSSTFFQHIYELYVTTGGSWKHADLTALTGAPPEHEGFLTAFPWVAGGTKQVVFKDTTGHVQELSVAKGGSWKAADLTQIAGAPPLSGPIVHFEGFEWLGFKEIVYISGGHIHELYVSKGGTWQHADLTSMVGAPPASNEQLCGYSWKAGGTKQVVYLTQDQHIHELYAAQGGGWKHADLTQITQAPIVDDVNFRFNAYAWEAAGTKQVVYIGLGGHIHELYVGVGGAWHHADLTQLTGAPVPTATASASVFGYAWEFGGTKQVVYASGDGHVQELSVAKGGSWKHSDLTQLTGSPPLW